MNLINDWNEQLYREIAKKSESKQAVLDVKYTRLLFHNKTFKQLHLRFDNDAMILGTLTSESMRIVAIATDKNLHGKGLGGQLLKMAEIMAQRHGCKRIYTVTESGKRFYEKYGYITTERRKNGWEMTKRLASSMVTVPQDGQGK